MSSKYAVTSEGLFECKGQSCTKVFKNKNSVYSHYAAKHGKPRNVKAKQKKSLGDLIAKKASLKRVDDPVGGFVHRILSGQEQRRVKFCPECGHEIPTGLMFGS